MLLYDHECIPLDRPTPSAALVCAIAFGKRANRCEYACRNPDRDAVIRHSESCPCGQCRNHRHDHPSGRDVLPGADGDGGPMEAIRPARRGREERGKAVSRGHDGPSAALTSSARRPVSVRRRGSCCAMTARKRVDRSSVMETCAAAMAPQGPPGVQLTGMICQPALHWGHIRAVARRGGALVRAISDRAFIPALAVASKTPFASGVGDGRARP
jgi:hypothetical protein